MTSNLVKHVDHMIGEAQKALPQINFGIMWLKNDDAYDFELKQKIRDLNTNMSLAELSANFDQIVTMLEEGPSESFLLAADDFEPTIEDVDVEGDGGGGGGGSALDIVEDDGAPETKEDHDQARVNWYNYKASIALADSKDVKGWCQVLMKAEKLLQLLQTTIET